LKLYINLDFTNNTKIFWIKIFNYDLYLVIIALYLLSDLANVVTGEIRYVDAGYNKVGMPDPKNIS